MWPSDLYTKLFKGNWEVQILKLWAEHQGSYVNFAFQNCPQISCDKVLCC